jgi:zona occludens toxin (predicted ATPase)
VIDPRNVELAPGVTLADALSDMSLYRVHLDAIKATYRDPAAAIARTEAAKAAALKLASEGDVNAAPSPAVEPAPAVPSTIQEATAAGIGTYIANRSRLTGLPPKH